MGLTWAGVLAHRLERQHLSSPADTGAEVVRRLGAVLAHDPVAAELAVGLRASSPMPGAVEAALAMGPLSPDELGEALAAHTAYRHLQPVFDDDPWTLLKALCWQGALQVGPTREGRPTLCRTTLER